MDSKYKQIITKVLNKHAQEAYSPNPALRKWIGNTSVVGVVEEIEKEIDNEDKARLRK